MPGNPDDPSAAELAIIYWLSIIAATILGLALLYFASQANNPQSALELRVFGILSLAIAISIPLVNKLLSFLSG